jgi:hypothetical protein
MITDTPTEQAEINRIIRLAEEFKRRNAGKVRKVMVGEVSVDSGRVVIIDPCYLHDGKPGPGGLEHATEGWKEEKRMSEVDKASGGWIDDNTGEAKKAGSIYNGLAVASSTGYGDGTYPVYAR